MPVSHDPGDVGEEVHPGVLGLFVPHVDLLQVGAYCVKEYVGHHPEVVAGDAHVAVETSKPKQDHLGLEESRDSLIVNADTK